MYFKPEYILILAFTIVIDFIAGIMIENTQNEKQKKYFLLLSFVANIGILAVFKYYNFINDNITGFGLLFGLNNHLPVLKMLLPIGLSFHTFQAMSYTIEVYRGNQKAERHFGIYALYVMFFPQLVAGPIERPQNMLHQFYDRKVFRYQFVVEGLRLILWGLFKKMVIADRLSVFVTMLYDNPTGYHGFQVILILIFFAFQIYCDFSGYSDIAIGSARVMGFDLMKNFNYPFKSKNITEFWRRWHISLSTWFNDYLFTPMVVGTREYGKLGIALSLFVTFTLSGLWHGAGWNFVIYGTLHGGALIFEFVTKKGRKRISNLMPPFLYNTVSQALTFGFCVFSWIFFRGGNLNVIGTVIKRSLQFSQHGSQISLLGTNAYELILSLVFVLVLISAEHILQNREVNEFMNGKSKLTRWSIYLVLGLAILNFGKFGYHSFIYFQF